MRAPAACPLHAPPFPESAGKNTNAPPCYTIATTTGGIIGFDLNKFTIDATGFTNALHGGIWSLALGNSNLDLNLNFTADAIPEPSTYAMLFGAITLGLVAYRKHRAAHSATT